MNDTHTRPRLSQESITILSVGGALLGTAVALGALVLSTTGRIEHRIDRVDDRLLSVEKETASLRVEVTELRADVNGLRTDLTELRTDFTELRADVNELRADVNGLRADFERRDTAAAGSAPELSASRG